MRQKTFLTALRAAVADRAMRSDRGFMVHWAQPWRSAPIGETYYAFVEDISHVATDRPYHGPANDIISIQAYDLGSRAVAVRMSGIKAGDFHDALQYFDHLPLAGPIDPDERARRRRALMAYLGPIPLPVFHTLVDSDTSRYLRLRAGLRRFEWVELYLGHAVDDVRLPVAFHAVPEDEPEESTRSPVVAIRSPDPFILYRLRDIFSLAHVADAGFEDRGQGGDRRPEGPSGLHGSAPGERAAEDVFQEVQGQPPLRGLEQ
jgi:hypothetical protein